jgi:hypothetical protein
VRVNKKNPKLKLKLKKKGEKKMNQKKLNLNETELNQLKKAYDELGIAYNMSENEPKPVTTAELKTKIHSVFETEADYVEWGYENLGKDSIAHEQSYHTNQTEADALSTILEEAEMKLTYKIGEKVVVIVDQLETLVEYT